LTDGTFHTTIAVTGNGTYTENLSNWPNGTVAATLTVSDPAGNSFSATATAARPGRWARRPPRRSSW